MEVIIAIALQMDTYQALLFRQWFISKVVNRDCQAEQSKTRVSDDYCDERNDAKRCKLEFLIF